MELAAHQSPTELMSDLSKKQSSGELLKRKFLRSSVKIKHLQWLIKLHRLFINTLKRKGHKTEPCVTPEVTRKYRERGSEMRTRDCWLSNCETR
jgi:hypothetical protein